MAEQPVQTAPEQSPPLPPADQAPPAESSAGAPPAEAAPAAAPAPKVEEKYQHPERVKKYVSCAADPVRADKPAGDVVRYDEEFEQLQAQMDRITSLTGEQTDWRRVVELSSSILQSKSKDLLVMTYMGVGLFEQEGYHGLAAALDGYAQFVRKFWDDCFPKVKPPHGRLNAVTYLLDKLLPQIELKGPQAKRHPTADEKEAVHACSEFMEEFASACDEKFAGMGDSPNTGPVSRALKALKQKVGPIGAEAEAAAAAEAARKAAAAAPRPSAAADGAAAPAGGFDAGPATFNTATQAVDQVKKIARYLLSQDNKDARGYRLSRLALLGNLAEPKDRLIPGIPKPTRAAMENQAASGDWQNLLSAAEAQFLITPLWLDLQRYVATALNGMGPMYEAAKKAVIFETIALQDRLPAVFDLSFKDGEPFANGSTKGWLAEARKEFGAGGGGGGGDDRLSKAVSEARKEQKPEDAVSRLRREVDGSASRRDQFRARLMLAQFCMDFKKLGVAQSIYQGLEEEMRAFNLAEWEPALAAEALRGLYACLSANKAKPTPEEMVYRGAVFGRLCCLDPSTAFKLDGAAAPAPPAPAPAAAPAAARAGA